MVQALIPFEQIGARRTDPHRGGRPQKYVLDEPGRRLLLARYDGRTDTITELVQALHVPRYVVRKWGRDLGLARQKELPWSAEDITYLETSLHRVSVAQIARHLGRSRTAVRLKAKRLGMNKTSEGYTMRGLCLGLGCDHHLVQRWVHAGWLKGTHRRTERTPQQGGDMWYFSDQAVRQFVRAHPGEIDPRRADWLWLVDVLTGK